MLRVNGFYFLNVDIYIIDFKRYRYSKTLTDIVWQPMNNIWTVQKNIFTNLFVTYFATVTVLHYCSLNTATYFLYTLPINIVPAICVLHCTPLYAIVQHSMSCCFWGEYWRNCTAANKSITQWLYVFHA